MSLMLEGRFESATETEWVGKNGDFAKRTMVLDITNGSQYDNFASLELNADKCDLVDNLKKGQRVEVFFNVEGRKWTAKSGKNEGKEVVFTTLKVWKINLIKSENAADVKDTPEAPPSASGDLPDSMKNEDVAF